MSLAVISLDEDGDGDDDDDDDNDNDDDDVYKIMDIRLSNKHTSQ